MWKFRWRFECNLCVGGGGGMTVCRRIWGACIIVCYRWDISCDANTHIVMVLPWLISLRRRQKFHTNALHAGFERRLLKIEVTYANMQHGRNPLQPTNRVKMKRRRNIVPQSSSLFSVLNENVTSRVEQGECRLRVWSRHKSAKEGTSEFCWSTDWQNKTKSYYALCCITATETLQNTNLW